jgi:Tfp pilus assembly protein PilO
MAMSKREKTLAICVGAVVGLLAVDHYALTPLLDAEEALALERDRIVKDIQSGQKQLTEKKRMTPKWKGLLTGGLKDDPTSAESQVLHALRDWARECGLTLSSMKPDRPQSKEALKEVQVQATATGNMDALTKFLWKAHSASFPLKVIDFQASTKADGSEELMIQIRVSTLYLARDAKTALAEAPKAKEGAN